MKLKPEVTKVALARGNWAGCLVEVLGLILGLIGLIGLTMAPPVGIVLLVIGIGVFVYGVIVARKRTALKCPKCAEVSKPDAKICKACGFSFYEEL